MGSGRVERTQQSCRRHFVTKIEENSSMVVLGDSFRQWKDCIRSKAKETSGALFSQDEAYEFTKEVLSGNTNESKVRSKTYQERLVLQIEVCVKLIKIQRPRSKEDLTEENNSKKIKLSFFIQENESAITKILYEAIPRLDSLQLKKFWGGIISQFDQHFILDYNIVDWENLSKEIRKSLINSHADGVVDELLRSKLDVRLRQEDEVRI
ncbi:hypothetical protein EDC94DRAFT_661254 [Helicostylum pulchrum]|nr:hypothetical protein EDC94DRAFT_661254 [Helicostylum pulchrum]